jgi:hypothetical protein
MPRHTFDEHHKYKQYLTRNIIHMDNYNKPHCQIQKTTTSLEAWWNYNWHIIKIQVNVISKTTWTYLFLHVWKLSYTLKSHTPSLPNYTSKINEVILQLNSICPLHLVNIHAKWIITNRVWHRKKNVFT